LRIVGFLGGTFDPVHFGHLRIGLEIKNVLALDELHFVPCAKPPHKSGVMASAEHRSRMLELAIENIPGFALDTRELDRQGLSYSIDTLKSIREEYGDATSICWIVGSDSFQSLDTWHQWEQLFDFAHIVVACRPGWKPDVESAVGQQLSRRIVNEPSQLKQTACGLILPWQVTQLAISATAIREMVAKDFSPRFLLPDAVRDFIELNKLYRQ